MASSIARLSFMPVATYSMLCLHAVLASWAVSGLGDWRREPAAAAAVEEEEEEEEEEEGGLSSSNEAEAIKKQQQQKKKKQPQQQKQPVLYELQLGAVGEDSLHGNADLARLHGQDGGALVNPSLLLVSGNTSRAPSGKVLDACFLDSDTAAAQLTTNHLAVAGGRSPLPNIAACGGLAASRLVVVAAEQKVLVWDLVSGRVREVPRPALDGKAPTCLAVLLLGGQSSSSPVLPHPLLAVGCSDGVVRVLGLSSLRPIARLVSPHKSSLTSLLATAAPGGRWEQVTGCFQGGSMVVWEPLAQPLGGGLGSVVDVGPRADGKVHDKEVVGCCQLTAAQAPDHSHSLIITAGVDSRVVGLEPGSLKEALRLKLETRPTCLAHWPRGLTCSGTHSLLLGTEAGVLLALHPESGSSRLALNMNGLVPNGAKKQPKLYCVAVHPLQPQWVALATNTGTALLQLDVLLPLPAMALPLRSPLQAITSGGSGITFVTAMGDSVYCVTAALAAPPPALGAGPNAPTGHGLLSPQSTDSPLGALMPGAAPAAPQATTAASQPMHVQLLGCLKLGSSKPPSRAVLGCSPDGAYVSCCWPAAGQYAVYRQGAAAWEE
ncbi:hypothetical protein QJQ45_000340 [Haematococcus lacustris]|nr:hypothetical protein QJQ45_000340 [Haematococcus lacustris]